MQETGGDGRDLPAGAIPCEMVYTGGYDSFINTDIVPSNSMSYEADVCWVKPSSLYQSFFGYNISSIRFSFHLNASGKVEIGYGNAYAGNWPTTNYRNLRVRHRVSITPSGSTIETYSTDGALLNTQSISYSATPSFTKKIGLLGRKKSDTSIESGNFRGGLGRFKLYGDSSFGTLVADFIPCYYNGNFGMWDKVSQTFLVGNSPGDIYGFGDAWNTTGFTPNARNNTSNSTSDYFVDYRGEVSCPMFKIPAGCSQIQFNAGTPSSGENYALMFFNGSKSYISYYNNNSADRIVSVPNNAEYVRMSMVRSSVNTCYIRDYTNGTYIWKGISV